MDFICVKSEIVSNLIDTLVLYSASDRDRYDRFHRMVSLDSGSFQVAFSQQRRSPVCAQTQTNQYFSSAGALKKLI